MRLVAVADTTRLVVLVFRVKATLVVKARCQVRMLLVVVVAVLAVRVAIVLAVQRVVLAVRQAPTTTRGQASVIRAVVGAAVRRPAARLEQTVAMVRQATPQGQTQPIIVVVVAVVVDTTRTAATAAQAA